MTPTQIIVLASPVFFLLIVLELAWSATSKARLPLSKAYRVNDMVNSISLGVISQLAGILLKVVTIGIYTLVFSSVAVFPDLAFWNTWYGVLLALVFYDFCYYWLHRAGHVVNLFWAAHVAHHQSQHYNLSTALRQSSTPFFSWIFYLPMAIAGVPPRIFAIVGLIDLLYQYWVHTEQIGKLGWFDRWFCSPSNHRVHHAVNDRYVDRNYGGVLVIWDRLFGSFQEELDEEPCVYGTRDPLNSWDPIWANFSLYWGLLKISWHTRRWSDKVGVWFKPPGWLPADVAQTHGKPAFSLSGVQTYNPALTGWQQGFAVVQFFLWLGASSLLMWNVHTLTLADTALWCAALVLGFWSLGLYMQKRLSLLQLLMLQSAVLATLAAIGLLGYYLALKPLPMSLAMVFIVHRAYARGAIERSDRLLLAAAFFSLVGDIFLMLPGNYFIPGLASFLVAHVFYVVLFKQGQVWFPNKRALALVLCFGGLMYAVLWGGLGPVVLKVAVAAYVLVISLMTSQAIGRASVNGDTAAKWVAIGACVFMLSDSFIAINRFVTPVPLASLWVLATYFAAQMLIVHFSRPTLQNAKTS